MKIEIDGVLIDPSWEGLVQYLQDVYGQAGIDEKSFQPYVLVDGKRNYLEAV